MSDGNTNEAENPGTDDDSGEGGSILDDGGIDTDERAGRSQGIDPTSEPDEDTRKEIEEEREQRLDPENRPDNVEVDNTDRTFDVERGQFTDSEDYDESAPAPFADPEGEDDDDEKSHDTSDQASDESPDDSGVSDDSGDGHTSDDGDDSGQDDDEDEAAS